MKIDFSAYQESYHYPNGKFKDNWQEGIKCIPFTSNPTSAIDKRGGLSGSTGAFFRMLEDEDVQPINDFTSAETSIRSYLENKKMSKNEIEEFIVMFRDIMQINGALNVTDAAFLKYLPLVPSDEMISEKEQKKYKAGQNKIANFIASMVDEQTKVTIPESKNLFTQIIREALSISSGFGTKKSIDERYYVLPFIKDSFQKDFEWLMSQESNTIVRYIHLLLHFYVCYAVMQSLLRLSPKESNLETPIKLYYILNSERASVTHDAVESWKKSFPKIFLDKIYGRSQSLDILNCVLGGNIGFYPDILSKISETPFELNKVDCEELLERYQKEKRELFDNRNSEHTSMDIIDVTVNSYQEFVEKLDRLCVGLQSQSYISRMRKKVIDLLSMRMLQLRRGNYVLTLDNEMLVFLIGLITKGKRVKLENVYKAFQDYGIVFNRGTRLAIESYLLKLNLLIRKSDSGEAQYVKVIL